MTAVSIDALARRRALADKIQELEDVQRRLGRTENALRSLQQVLSAVADPVEVIGENLLVQYANRASRDIHGETVESKPYYSALLGLEAPGDDCPVQATLRDGTGRTTESERDGLRVEIVLVPTTLSGGQRAVVRTTRPLGAAPPDTSSGETQPDATEPAFREVEWLRRIALACVGPTRTSAMLDELLPVLTAAFAADAAMYYHCDDRAKRYVLLGVDPADENQAPPTEIKGEGFADLERVAGSDQPYLRVTGMTSASALPASLHSWARSCDVDELILVPVSAARTRHGAVVLARRDALAVVPGPQDQLMRAMPEIIGTAIERNVVLRTIERGVSALLNT